MPRVDDSILRASVTYVAPLESVWDDYWYFNGTTDYLEMAHNPDFDVPDTLYYGSWIVGYRDESAADGTRALIEKGQMLYTGATNGDMALHAIRGGGGTTNQIQFGYRRQAGNWVNCYPNDYYNDDTDAVANGARCSVAGQTNVVSFVDDKLGADGGCNSWEGTGLNYNGNSQLLIGAQRRHDGGAPTIRYYFKGRIYFAAWMLSTVTRWGDSTGAVMMGNRYFVPWRDDPARTPDLHYAMAVWWFNKPVAGTYPAEVASGPNAPYVMTVYGSPVLNGP